MTDPGKTARYLLVLCVASCLFIAACGAPKSLGESLAAQKKLGSYHLDLKAPNRSAQQWVKMAGGEMRRMRFETGDKKTIYVYVDKGEMYVHDTEKGVAMMMPLDPAKISATARPAGKISKDTPVKGSETLDGVDCWVVEYENRGKKRRVWVSKQWGLPRKAVVNGRETRFTYDKINAVPDSVFEMPKGVRIMDLRKLKGMGAGS